MAEADHGLAQASDAFFNKLVDQSIGSVQKGGWGGQSNFPAAGDLEDEDEEIILFRPKQHNWCPPTRRVPTEGLWGGYAGEGLGSPSTFGLAPGTSVQQQGSGLWGLGGLLNQQGVAGLIPAAGAQAGLMDGSREIVNTRVD